MGMAGGYTVNTKHQMSESYRLSVTIKTWSCVVGGSFAVHTVVYTPYLRKYPKITKNTLKGEQKSCYKIGLDYYNIYLHLNGVRYN